jgi:hypothetical protein
MNMGAGPSGKSGKDGKTKPIAFTETSRQTQKIKIHDPGDEDIYIIVERIIKLEFKDEKSGSILVWTR